MSEFSEYVKKRAETLGRTEASVRSKLYQMEVNTTDSPTERDKKILEFLKGGNYV